MANISLPTTNHPIRVNQYCKAMRYSSDVNFNGHTRVSFTPYGSIAGMAAASTTNIINARPAATAGTIDATAFRQSDALYGRTISVVSTATVTGTISVFGWDYIGQPMQENFTINGATTVNGKKAFRTLREIRTPSSAVGGATMSVGWGPSLGLPYKTVRVEYETNNQALVTAGTLIAPILTVPQTAVTGDPRGLYTPTTVLNGAGDGVTETGNIITAAFHMQNDIDINGVGGLYGVPHFAG